jgi:tetratricopeptide (TPR) repeat protein
LASERPATFNPDLAHSLNNLSLCLSDHGDHEEALAAIQQSVKIHQSLASERPAKFNPALRKSLDNLSQCLSKLGHHEEAQATHEQAANVSV